MENENIGSCHNSDSATILNEDILIAEYDGRIVNAYKDNNCVTEKILTYKSCHDFI